MLEAIAVKDPYNDGHLKQSFQPIPGRVIFEHPGVPERESPTAVRTAGRSSNVAIVYTRITPLDSHLSAGKPGGCVFVSRTKVGFLGDGPFSRSLSASTDVVNRQLAKADAMLPLGTNPLDAWRSLASVNEWSLDGVLKGIGNEENATEALNVCVSGWCATTNVFDKESAFAGDECYILLVAERVEGMGYRMQYHECTGRPMAEPRVFQDPLLARRSAPVSREQRRTAVGAWRVGKVVDSTAVHTQDQHTLTVNVCCEWVGWRELRDRYSESEIGEEFLMRADAPSDDPDIIFNWPSYVAKDRSLESPSVPKKSENEKIAERGQDMYKSRRNRKRKQPDEYSQHKKSRILHDEAPTEGDGVQTTQETLEFMEFVNSTFGSGDDLLLDLKNDSVPDNKTDALRELHRKSVGLALQSAELISTMQSGKEVSEEARASLRLVNALTDYFARRAKPSRLLSDPK
jgi:hypothetical protein